MSFLISMIWFTVYLSKAQGAQGIFKLDSNYRWGGKGCVDSQVVKSRLVVSSMCLCSINFYHVFWWWSPIDQIFLFLVIVEPPINSEIIGPLLGWRHRHRHREVEVWNGTVANLTLLALGSSALGCPRDRQGQMAWDGYLMSTNEYQVFTDYISN
jgi:hypothetical protein